MDKRIFRRLTGAILSGCIALSCTFPAAKAEQTEEYRKEYYQATCTSPAYWLYESTVDGTIRVVDDGEPLGHQWVTENDVTYCAVCGAADDRILFDIPQIHLNGSLEGIGKKERILIPVEYVSSDLNFSCYGYMSTQGHSTLEMEKKNYTMRLFDDEQMDHKHSLTFEGWHKEHKYILKAYLEDPTMCRDLVCADIWAEMVASRRQIHPRLLQSAAYGAVVGFPVTVWLEGEFLGLYTMNLHKDNDLYVMSKHGLDAVLICNAETMPEALFRAEPVYEDHVSDWEIEFAGDDDTWVRNHFNEMIHFVMESDDAAFREQLQEYMDVEAAMDYLLFIWAMGLSNNAAKDLVMLTYGEQWIPSAYDMEDGIGTACAADAFLPTLGAQPDSATGSLLWDRLLTNFTPEIRERYALLRQGPLSEENIQNKLVNFWNSIPQKWRDLELETYPGRGEPSLEDLQTFITQRLPLLDEALER